MEIPLNAEVQCTDGAYGKSVFVLIDPVVDQVTNLVVQEDSSPNKEFIVPIEFITDTIDDTILLSCSKAELEKMDPFIKTKFIQQQMPERYSRHSGVYGFGSMYYLPYATAPDITVHVEQEIQQIPPGELTMHRGTTIEATDGYVGKVDEFVVHPDTGRITHLVMREGHLWGKKEVIIPLSALKPMDDTHEDTVYLNLNKDEVESLPTFPLNRGWF